jgi:hypothetical protein
MASKDDDWPMRRLGRYREWCMMLRIAWGEHGHSFAMTVLGCGIGEALRDGMGRGIDERSRIPCVLRSSFAAA